MRSGVIRVPLAPIRAASNDRAELVTQALFGELLEWRPAEEVGWAEVRLLGDGYRGFLDVKMLAAGEDAVGVFESGTCTLTSPLTPCEWEGRTCHLPAGSRVPESLLDRHPVPFDSPVDAAHGFLGAPYLWGGKSILGIDCSGLTQLSSTMAGMALPRDASQQWESLAANRVGFEALAHGDLVFFHKEGGSVVTHVGFALDSPGGWQVLHASGEVRMDALTEDGILKEGRLTHRWTGAARIGVSAG